jgi:hypothetical protein
MVHVGNVSSIMQIISKNAHYDKRPANALLSKAIEVCAEKGKSHFIYGQYVYGNNNDGPLTEFKRRNGFEQILLPRYYVPLTAWGRFCVARKLHLGVRRLLPRAVENTLLQWRAKFLDRTSGRRQGAEEEKTDEAATSPSSVS